MTLAVAGFCLWGWITDGFRKLFRRERKEKQVSEKLKLFGSVKRKVAYVFGVAGAVTCKLEKQVSLWGENLTLITLDLLMEEDD